MKKNWILLEELRIWLRGRFTLTSEEKFWLLLILIICWTGLVSRYIHLRHQKPEIFSPERMKPFLKQPLDETKK